MFLYLFTFRCHRTRYFNIMESICAVYNVPQIHCKRFDQQGIFNFEVFE